MKTFFTILLLLSSQYVRASNFIEKGLLDDPIKSPGEVLRLAYEAATDEMKIEYINKPETNCVITNTDFEDTLDKVFLNRFVTIKPAVPGKGPLFPGTPAVYKEGVAIAATSDGSLPNQAFLDQLFNRLDVNSSYSQIDVVIQGGFFDFSGILKERLSVRKSGDLKIFERVVESNYRPTTVQYGYCWY